MGLLTLRKALLAVAAALLVLAGGLSYSATVDNESSEPVVLDEGVQNASALHCGAFWINSSVADMTSAAPNAPVLHYLLTSNGGVYTPCAPFFGSAAGQPYFAGKTADYIKLCWGYDPWGQGVIGYVIVNTQGQTYYYGSTNCIKWIDN